MDVTGLPDDSFLSALSQPLFIQTPLQVILQTLFTTVRSQATALADLQAKVDASETSQASSRALLLHRLSALEEDTAELRHNTNVQQQTQGEALNNRLVSLETTCKDNQKAIKHVEQNIDEEVEPRILQLERKLYATDNLAGRAMAVDEIADVLGVTIHRVMPVVPEEPVAPNSASPAPRPSVHHPAAPEAGIPEKAATRRSTTGDVTNPGVLSKLQQDFKMSEAREVDMKRKLEDMQATLLAVQRALDGSEARIEKRIAQLENDAKFAKRRPTMALSEGLSPRALATRREETGPTFADISALQDQFRATHSDVTSVAARIAALESRLPRMQEELAASVTTAATTLRKESIAKNAALQEDISQLNDDMRQLQTQVLDLEAKATAGPPEPAPFNVDTEAIVLQVQQRLEEQHDFGRITEQAVAAALDAFNEAAEQEALAAAKQNGLATRFRCLSCDADLRHQRPVVLNAMQSRQGLIPKVDALMAREAASPPAGPGLGAGEMRRLQELAAERESPHGSSPGSSPAHSKTTTPHHSPPRQHPATSGLDRDVHGLQTNPEDIQRPGTSVPRERLVKFSGGDPLSLLQQPDQASKLRQMAEDDAESASMPSQAGNIAGSRARGIPLGDVVVSADVWETSAPKREPSGMLLELVGYRASTFLKAVHQQ
ncbi:hypothetical protein WJX72_007294 [[Myrmecia] bisecta]|uniref:Uncharacterized protein n=1 Tax=[Myrmecia] bisecta TaxID=41462 RepID=A0AAW1PYS6_9CHLO